MLSLANKDKHFKNYFKMKLVEARIQTLQKENSVLQEWVFHGLGMMKTFQSLHSNSETILF